MECDGMRRSKEVLRDERMTRERQKLAQIKCNYNPEISRWRIQEENPSNTTRN
jgi:hypothetical protein